MSKIIDKIDNYFQREQGGSDTKRCVSTESGYETEIPAGKKCSDFKDPQGNTLKDGSAEDVGMRPSSREKEMSSLKEAISKDGEGESVTLKGKKYVYHAKMKPRGWYLHDGNTVRFISPDRPKEGQRPWREVKAKRKEMGL